MNIAAIETWLQAFAGLEASSIGADAVARAARERITTTGCPSVEAYLARLQESEEERHALIDRVVVPETWFFRDRPAIDALVRHVMQDWGRAHRGLPFRVLSVPCSTGEEPYSLAMAFALASWPLELLRIDAIDISRQSLERAQRGVYGRNSFRGEQRGFRDAFFEPVGSDTWKISQRVRAPVHFATGNLLADEFAKGRRPYHAIFCRNLLIYFDRPTQARAVQTLDRLLAPGGWFAVGPSEPVLMMEYGYELLKVKSGFVLQRATTTDSTPPLAKRPAAAAVPVLPWREIARPAAPAAPPLEEATATAAARLQAVQDLADAGRFREAKKAGEALLAQGGASAPLLFVLGVVAEATGDTTGAEALYRKTVYLDPQHTEALAHLATRAELNGDLRGARALRERAQRALAREAR
ncbi:MAG: chemotaxis protein CheR [Verrucomicrobia bacterium]|nr:chemotaxis protein CheR [Verrucomicrobiota bacterium]